MKPELVREALFDAMSNTRPHWSEEFCKWIVELIDLSLRSSVGCFEDQWYVQKNGIPTGGSLCVQIANITVYYAMNKCVYSNSSMMKRVTTARRYIDDGFFLWDGTKEELSEFIKHCKSFHSTIKFTFKFNFETKSVIVLDMVIWIDDNGMIQTDLFKKAGRKNQYLLPSSAHPQQTTNGIPFSYVALPLQLKTSLLWMTGKHSRMKE